MTTTEDDDTPRPGNSRRSVELLRGLATHPLADISAFVPTPAEYVRTFGRLRSEAQWEVVRSFLHPMLMQRIPLAEIASYFRISEDTAGRWKKRYYDDLRREAVTMQPRDFIMESMESLREARAEAWKGYYLAPEAKEKRGFLQTVTQIEARFARLGESVGLYGGRSDKPMASATYGGADEDPHAAKADFIQDLLIDYLTVASGGPEPDWEQRFGATVAGSSEGYDSLLAELRDPIEEQTAQVDAPPINITVRRRPRPA